MSGIRMRSRAVVALAATAVLAAILVPSAGAQKVANPGEITIAPSSGKIVIRNTEFDMTPPTFPECSDFFDNDGDNRIDESDPSCAPGPAGEPASADNSELVAGFQPVERAEFKGTIDADGNVNIPISGVKFPTAYIGINHPSLGLALVTARVVATHPAVGTLDPTTREATLRVRLRVQLTGQPFNVDLGAGCTIGSAVNPIDINVLTTGTSTSPTGSIVNGSPYHPTFGTVTVVNNNFSVPGASGCGNAFLNLNPTINAEVGIPSPAGNNSATLTGLVAPLFTAPATTAAPTTAAPTTAAPTTAAPTTAAPTTTVVSSGNEDRVSVAISGATTYSASGPLNSGDLRVPMRGNDVLGVRGVGSITGPGGGSTRVGIDVTRVEWLGISIGRVAVYDLSAQLNLVLPYFGRLARQDGAVSGMARGIQNVGAPTWFAPVQIDWSVSDAG